MSDIALSFLALLPRLILGFLILHLFWDSKRPQDLFLKITLAGAVGFGVSSLLGFLWLWAGLPLKIYAWIETGIALGLAFRTAKREITGSVFQSPAGIFSNKRHALWGVTVSGVFLLAGADAFLWGIQNPYGRTDAWLNWNVVSRFIFRGGDQWMRTFQRPFDHPDYPFLAPLSNAVTW